MPDAQPRDRTARAPAADAPNGAPARSGVAAARRDGRAGDGIVRGALARLADRPDLNAFLDHVLAAGVEELAAASNALFTFDPASRTFQLRAFVLGPGALGAAAPTRRGSATGPIRWHAAAGGTERPRDGALRQKLPFVEADPATWPRSAQCHQEAGHGLVLSAPVLFGERLLGFTVARFADRTPPSPEQTGVAEALATQAALALELLRLADDARDAALVRERAHAAAERTAQFEQTSTALQATTDALARMTELDEIIPTVLRILGRTFSCRAAAFFDVGAGARVSLRHCLANGRMMAAPDFLACDIGPPAMRERFTRGFVVCSARLATLPDRRTRAIVVDHRTDSNDATVDAWTRDVGCELELNVLLLADGAAVGMLTMYRQADLPYTDGEIALAEALATLLALAVGGARLATAAREHAIAHAVANEQRLAAVEDATVLARANEALRSWMARIAAQEGATTTTRLEAFVLEAVAATGAAIGLYVQRVREVGTECTMRALTVDGTLVRECRDEDVEAEFRFRATTAADRAGVLHRTFAGEALVYPVADLAAWYPESYAYHHGRGDSMVGHFPVRIAGVVTGYLGLVWPADGAPEATVIATSRVIALQASLALEMQRLADEARAAAVAAERHAATIAVADERTRLAREMHDTLAQGLAGVVMHLGAARAKLGPAYAKAAPQLDRVDRLARDTLAVARRAITVLRPDASEAEGLEAALRRMIEQPGAPFGGRLTLEVTGIPVRAPAEVEFELLRIAQAALANAVQHAAAARIAVTLDYRPVPDAGSPPGGGGGAAPETARADRARIPALRLVVADDGAGFESTVPRPGHFGLVGMRERAARVGAALTLVTAPGEGTEVVVVWPAVGASP